MSSRRPPPAAEILAYYAAGYFPLYDLSNTFYWERLPLRAVIEVTPENLHRATKLARRSKSRFEIRYTTALPQVLSDLRDPAIKPHSWVQSEVVSIYHTLHNAGLLQTIEAWDNSTGHLAGALLGIVLPGTFIAETMYSLQPDASKICLCQLLHDAHAAGHKLIDVQTPHHLDENGLPLDPRTITPHPCLRLGERLLPLPLFLRMMHNGFATTFPGTLADWLSLATTLARFTPAATLQSIPHPQLTHALPMLLHNLPESARTLLQKNEQ